MHPELSPRRRHGPSPKFILSIISHLKRPNFSNFWSVRSQHDQDRLLCNAKIQLRYSFLQSPWRWDWDLKSHFEMQACLDMLPAACGLFVGMERGNERWKVYKELLASQNSNRKSTSPCNRRLLFIRPQELSLYSYIPFNWTHFTIELFRSPTWSSSSRLPLQRSLLPSTQHQLVGPPMLIFSSMPWL